MKIDDTPRTPAAGKVARALLSVHDKTGLVELAQGLRRRGVELLASGGTAAALEGAGVEVVRIEAFTGAREVLDGRVKTLHPKVHGGILADRRKPEHLRDLEENGYGPIDLVICNLYPFTKVLAEGAQRHVMVEYIDIGGPTLVRAAAKNADGGVTVLTDPADYAAVLAALDEGGAVAPALRRKLAAKAFRQIASYDLAIAGWAERDLEEGAAPGSELPARIDGIERGELLRYGENPHQAGALYRVSGERNGVANGALLSGKALSYNNLLDMDAAYRAVCAVREPGCAIVKHTNPCGLAEADSQAVAFERALAGDPLSAFGGILGFNTPVDATTAAAIKASKLFVECIVAPGFTSEALDDLRKRENLRLFTVPEGSPEPPWHAHRIGGGFLVESADPGIGDPATWRCVTKKQLEEGWLDELAFAMRAVMVLKSNAIVVIRGGALHGAGAGFMSRVDATVQALEKAGDKTRGAFLGSDAFFPFPDSVRLAHEGGIVAIAQPGGSKRDDEVIAACDELGLAMVFTGRRHFKH